MNCFSRHIPFRAACLSTAAVVAGALEAGAQPVDPPPPALSADVTPGEPVETFYIRQFRVQGAKNLPRVNVESAVYRFMGPECSQMHVEGARAALEKAYRDKGLQTVTVSVPPQELRHGIVYLKVTEGRIGRLSVKGSRYFDIEKIKAKAPSLAVGVVPNFNDVQRDLLALNKHPDRQISPDVKPGAVPGTFDVELLVKDKFPLHGSLEINNRYSPDTSELRINGAISYTNLWQAGHTGGLSFQIAPERLKDAQVVSAFYNMPLESLKDTSLTLTATKQDSDISTLGGAAVLGRGWMAGARLTKTLPGGKNYYHTLSGGIDYKSFDQDVKVGTTTISTPITYWPVSLTYSGTSAHEHSSTDVNATLAMHFRGMGSATDAFDDKRFKANGAFVYLKADASHTRDLNNGMQVFGKVQGQVSSGPLINSEQFSGGGLGNARGYLESQVQGDSAIFGSVEWRSRSFIPAPARKEGEPKPSRPNEWRVYAFCDAGYLSNHDPLPEQDSGFTLASVGMGTRFRLRDHFNGSLDAAFPLTDAGTTDAGDITVTFRLWADF
jgi:hemolysin activation/secretion protein